MEIGMKRILETERLILREYVQADFDGLYAILSDDAKTMFFDAVERALKV